MERLVATALSGSDDFVAKVRAMGRPWLAFAIAIAWPHRKETNKQTREGGGTAGEQPVRIPRTASVNYSWHYENWNGTCCTLLPPRT